MSIEIRNVDGSELDAFRSATSAGFLGDDQPGSDVAFAAVEELERAFAAFDGSELVGTLGAFSLDLAVPGASLPTAGTTHITVRPTHRRRGLLHQLMGRHFAEVRERGEPLAALWATESGIYGRYGYGPAAQLMRVRVETHHAVFGPEVELSGSCRLITAEEAATRLPEVYESVWRSRPGHFARSRTWWDNRQLLDAHWQREGMSASRFAICEEAGRATGYAHYRVREDWDGSGLARGQLRFVEMQGTSSARASLWRLALDVDLVSNVTYWNEATDSELPWLLADARRVERSIRDSLWLRLMDVARSLEARSYASDGRIVLEVRDRSFEDNKGRYSLEASAGSAECRRTSDAAEIELDVADLASVYLGAHSFCELTRAGRAKGSPDAAMRADGMFRTSFAPWCPEIF